MIESLKEGNIIKDRRNFFTLEISQNDTATKDIRNLFRLRNIFLDIRNLSCQSLFLHPLKTPKNLCFSDVFML